MWVCVGRVVGIWVGGKFFADPHQQHTYNLKQYTYYLKQYTCHLKQHTRVTAAMTAASEITPHGEEIADDTSASAVRVCYWVGVCMLMHNAVCVLLGGWLYVDAQEAMHVCSTCTRHKHTHNNNQHNHPAPSCATNVSNNIMLVCNAVTPT